MTGYDLKVEDRRCVKEPNAKLTIEILDSGFNIKDKKGYCIIHADSILNTGNFAVNTGRFGCSNVIETNRHVSHVGRTDFRVTEENTIQW